MELTADQKQQVAAWIEDGAKLSDIQQRLAEAFDVRLTYMETRFLIDDLKLRLKEVAPEPKAHEAAEAVIGQKQAEPEIPVHDIPEPEPEELPELQGQAAGSGVSVRVDSITRPGAIVSGRVTFSDGKGAGWYLDQMGRLGLTPDEDGYRPGQSDVMAFQQALQREIARMGM